MAFEKIFAIRLLMAVLGICFLTVAIAQLHMALTDTSLSLNNQTATPTHFPIEREFDGQVVISTQITFPLQADHWVRIIPDDRLIWLELNGKPVDLSEISPQALQDWGSGFTIDLASYVHPGTNALRMQIENHSGRGGVRISALNVVPFSAGIFIPLFAGFALLFIVLARFFRLTPGMKAIALISIALICVYWLKTPFASRQFDIFEGGGHLDYIRYLYEHASLPPAGDGWEYHQPPLYYLSAVPSYALSQYFPLLGWEELLRTLSLGYWMIFLCSGLAIIQLQLRAARNTMVLAAIALCFWPSGIFHSIRAGNDVPFYAWYSLSLYATCKWWYSKSVRHFAWACAAMALAAITKSNGLAIMFVLISLLALRWLRTGLDRRHRDIYQLRVPTLLLGATCVTVILVDFAAKFVMYWQGRTNDWLLSNVSLSINPGLRVANEFQNYIGFDLHAFVSEVWVSAWDDKTGRQFFWNYLLRSGISSEFVFDNPILKTLATFVGLLLLWLISRVVFTNVRRLYAVVCAGNIYAWRNIYRALPLVLSGTILTTMLIAYRIKSPMACNGDFRYIYPVLISLIFAETGIRRLGRASPIGNGFVAPLIGLCGAVWILAL